MLQLEIQVFGDWLCQILHTEPVHDGETMSWRCQSGEERTKKHIWNLEIAELQFKMQLSNGCFMQSQ